MPREKPTFQQLVREHGGFVRRTLAQLGVSPRDLADVEQEVFRGADRGLSTFDPALAINPDTALRGWLFGICERQARCHRRAEVKRGEVLLSNEELDFTQSAVPSVEERLIDRERRELLLRLLDCIEPSRRAVVVAYELEGLAMTEVAAALSIPVNTAWNRLRLGREDLRVAWRKIAKKDGREGLLPLAVLFGEATWTAAPDSAPSGAGELVSRLFGAGPAPALAGTGVLAASVAIGALVLQAAMGSAASGAVAVAASSGVPVAVAEQGTSEESAAIPGAGARSSAAPSAEPTTIEAATVVEAAPVVPSSDKAPPSGPVRQRVRPAATASVAEESLRLELQRIKAAARALDRGDIRAASTALEAHERAFADGRLAGERELLTARILVSEGRRNEARDRARAFLRAHPESPFRPQLEQVVGGL